MTKRKEKKNGKTKQLWFTALHEHVIWMLMWMSVRPHQRIPRACLHREAAHKQANATSL